jgi:geranylgeranyl reductase
MKPNNYRTDILVIGGGPAGAVAAGVLAENGREVLLLEKNRAYTKPCGGGVALGIFDEFNLPRTSVQREVYGLRLVSPAGNQVDIPLPDHPVALVERKEFDEALRLKAEHQGAQVVEGEFLSILDEKKGLVRASILGERIEIRSEFIIAADGVNSRVRTSLGIKPLPALWTCSAVIPGRREFCEFWFGASESPYSYSWIFPTAGGLSVGTGTLEAKNLHNLFHNFLGRSGIEVPVKKRVYRIPVWQGKLFNRQKILFAGDAAGQVLPLSYEGIYYAMKAGEMAAKAILEGKPGHYKKMWKGEFGKRFLLLDTLNNYFLKNDASAEKVIALHRHPEVQEISLRLWLRQDDRQHTLFHYIKLLKKFLR